MAYEDVRKGKNPTDFVSVDGNGQWYISGGPFARHFDGCECVRVQHDTDRPVVAIKPTDLTDPPDDEPVYSLNSKTANTGGGAGFASTAALSSIGVELDERVRIEPAWDDDEQALVVDMAEYAGGE